jgi:hypothetical protein
MEIVARIAEHKTITNDQILHVQNSFIELPGTSVLQTSHIRDSYYEKIIPLQLIRR